MVIRTILHGLLVYNIYCIRVYVSVVTVGFVWTNGVPQLQTRLIGMVLRTGMGKVYKCISELQ